jgi:hypothetical protein
MDKLAAWLLAGPPWVQYQTRLSLLSQAKDSREVVAARQAMLAHPQVQALLADIAAWPGPALKRHNDAGHPLRKLTLVVQRLLRRCSEGAE